VVAGGKGKAAGCGGGGGGRRKRRGGGRRRRWWPPIGALEEEEWAAEEESRGRGREPSGGGPRGIGTGSAPPQGRKGGCRLGFGKEEALAFIWM
jgi:hypothetical protein